MTGPSSRRTASALLPVPSYVGARGRFARRDQWDDGGAARRLALVSLGNRRAGCNRWPRCTYGRSIASERVAVLRGDDIEDPRDRAAPFWISAAGGRRLVFSSNHLNIETVADFAAALDQFQPHVLYAYPTTLESLCGLLQSSGHSVSVPVTVCSSETIPERTWRLAADVLGSRLVDYYGLAERVSFAYAFEPDSYRFLPGYSYNELLPCGGDSDAIFTSSLRQASGT